MKKNVVLATLLALGTVAIAQESALDSMNTVIRKHGMDKSGVMAIAADVTDVYGPRLTGSKKLDTAIDWAQRTLKGWGMQNVHTEEWGPFGRSWELEHFEMHALEPAYFPLIAYPKAWSPSSKGDVSGEVVYLKASKVEDLEAYKGKLKGKFVLLDSIRPVKEWMEAPARRLDEKDLLAMANAPLPAPRPSRQDYTNLGGFSFNRALWVFLTEQEPLAVIDRSYKGDLGTVFVAGANAANGRSHTDTARVVPQVTLSVEHYNRLFRLLEKGLPVKLSMNLKVDIGKTNRMQQNVLAEIPGTDLKEEVVMFGAHFDSWHTGTGATDNGAGSAVMMEVARILLKTMEETGEKPRRTLRLALWTGEEQGLYGSRAYVKDHYGEMETPSAENSKVSAYYNLDNGTGKIRGVHLQGNAAVSPIFRAWLDAFKDLDATTLTLNNTGGTDHLSFDGVGIPGFQFIQEPISYFNRTHHSNMDNYDHLLEDDLKQAATIIASFVWHTAQRDEKLPRK